VRQGAAGLGWDDVVGLARTLPGVEEGSSYGTPALRQCRGDAQKDFSNVEISLQRKALESHILERLRILARSQEINSTSS